MNPVQMIIECDMQALEQMMDEKCTSNVPVEGEEKDDGGKNESPETFLSALTLRKCLIKFYISDNMLSALCDIENEVYGVKLKVKQELTLIDMCKK